MDRAGVCSAAASQPCSLLKRARTVFKKDVRTADACCQNFRAKKWPKKHTFTSPVELTSTSRSIASVSQ